MSIVKPTSLQGLGSPVRHPVPRQYRPDIQGLRAVAVILVVLYHAGVPGITGGYVGVDIFFVISGFLITRQLATESSATGRISMTRFYGRRMRRLLPPAAFVVVVTMIAARLVLTNSQVQSLAADIGYTAIYGLNYHLAIEGINYQQSSMPPSALQHFWSLAIEEQFYLIWPFLIVVCLFIGRRRFHRPLMMAVICVVTVVTVYSSISLTQTNTPMAYFSLHTRAWELGLGALVALVNVWLARIPGGLAATMTWAGLTAIGVGAFAYSDATPYPGTAALLPVLGAALVIAGGAQRNPRSVETTVLEHPIPQYIGKVSYAWYLWHWPMLMLLPAWVGHELGWLTNLEIVFLAFWAAVLTYFLENACHRSTWSMRKWIGAGVVLAAGTVVVALVATATLPSVVGAGAERTTTTLASPNVSTVQKALADGLRITELPSNLTPSLDQVKSDQPASTNDSCHAQLLEATPETCTYGDPAGTKTMVLVGDSHAQQWLGALIPNAEQHHWKIVTFTKAACPLAGITVWNNDLKRVYTECEEWRTVAIAMIRALNPDMIVASQSDSVPWDSVTDREWADGSVTALEGLAGARTRVVYLGDTPQTAQDPTICLQQHIDNSSVCAYARGDAYQQFPERHGMVQNAMTVAGFGYFDSLNLFCGDYCPAVVGNMIVRRDSGHITNTYATWLAPMLAPLFKDGTG